MSFGRSTKTAFSPVFSPDHFISADNVNQPYLLWMVLGIVMLAITLESLVDIQSHTGTASQSWLIIAVIDGGGLLLFLISRRGYIRPASYALVAVLWLLTTWIDWTQGGVYAPTLDIAYLVIIVIAGLLLGETAGIVMGAICSLSMLGLALGSIQIGYHPPQGQTGPLEIFWDDMVYIVIIVGLQYLSTTAIKNALAQAHQELTERRRVETALQQAKEYAENLIQAANTLVIGVDRQGAVTIFNPAAEKTTGYTRADLAARNGLDLALPKERFPEIWGQFTDSREFHTPRNFENPILTKWGEERLVIWQITPIGEEIIAFGIDITDRRRLEEDHHRNQTKLEVQQLLAGQREAERLKIARDLHDGPVQNLIGTTFAIRCLIEDTRDPKMQIGLEQIQTNLQTEVDNLRAYAGELRPPTLMKFGVRKAILDHIDVLQEKHPEISVDLDASQDGYQLPEDMRLVLFRVYQEAMTNILRHAHASQVKICYRIDKDQAHLIINDDGQGFKLPTDWTDLARRRHFGLVGMRERVEAAGGQLEIASHPGRGTNLHLILPVINPD